MLKKGLLTLVCLTVMSAVCAWAATTYSVRTQLTNSGGSIKVGNKAAQTTGIAYTNCTSAVTVVVTPNAGFKISALKQINGAVVTDITPADGTVAASVAIAKPTPVDPTRPAVLKAQGLTATFASTNTVVVPKTWQLQLTNTNSGGTIATNGTKAFTLASVGLPKLVNYTDATPVTAVVTATTGYKIKSVTTTGSIAKNGDDTVWTITGIPATGKSVNPVLATYQKLAYVVTTNAGIAPANPAVAHGGAVRLIVTPTGSNNKVNSLTVTGGTVALTDRFGAAVTLPFQGPVKATISNITSNITVTAAYGVDTTVAMERNCTNTCHLAASVSQSVKDVPAQWLQSNHKANGVDCVSCHKTMPGPQVDCSACHSAVALHKAGSTVCSDCHSFEGHKYAKTAVADTPLASHSGGAVAPGHAQYVSATVTCTNCHAGNAEIMAEYKASAHGNPAGEAWAHYDWRSASRAACQRCHNGTAFVAKLETLGDTANYFGATPPVAAGEVLNCSACHADVSTGALRTASNAFTVPLSNGATVAYNVPGASAICVRCHGGRETGDSIKLKVDAFTNLNFINSHYLSAGGTVYNKTGYEFAGQSYDSIGYHKNLGKDNTFATGTNGPCVACHMSEGHGHTWDFVSKDANGVITANNSALCASCHDGMNGAKLEQTKEAFHTALAGLKSDLAGKGIYFWPAYPYFFKVEVTEANAVTAAVTANAFKNWDAIYTGKGKDVMGAAFNYNLLEHDPGAYAHNNGYALKLISDSVDFLDNGAIDGSKTVAAPAHIAAPATACQTCHAGVNAPEVPSTATVTAAGVACVSCHTDKNITEVLATFNTTVVEVGCANCHNAIHTATSTVGTSCIGCHDVNIKHDSASSNDGVRSITNEFEKRSHHVTGRALQDSDCAVCHLEGKKEGSAVAVNSTNHMNDGVIDLRNGNTALLGNQTEAVGAGYPWNPAAPNHTLMDQFCFSCHNAAGAPDAFAAIDGVTGYTGTALNPFGDTVSNSYDQVSRVNVVDAYSQFDTGNSSHHAVRGQKYTAKTLTAAQFTNISTANMAFRDGATALPIKGVKAITGTMFELNKFNATYTTLNGVALADDNVLHCGDCHTVGQFRQADVNLTAGFNKAVIGAHGSNNEYMLRNSNGDDVLAKDALVCYICHTQSLYQAHNGANANATYCNGNDYNTAGLTGLARLNVGAYSSVAGRTVETFTAQVENGVASAAGGGNIYGNKCLACHNASDRKTFGGIHGNAGNASYTTYSGAKVASGAVTTVSRKPYRFMPGLGNIRYNGGDSADQWTVKTISQANKQGCYTLNGSSLSKSPTKAAAAAAGKVNPTALADDNGILGSWGACTDHAGTSVFGGRATTRTILRPLTY